MNKDQSLALLENCLSSTDPELIKNSINLLYKEYTSLVSCYTVSPPHLYYVTETFYRHTSLKKNNFIKLFEKINPFIHHLIENNILEDVLPYYVNTAFHRSKETFKSIKELCLIVEQQKLPFSIILNILDKIDEPYLVASKFWEDIYSSVEMGKIEPLELHNEFIKKYKPFTHFTSRSLYKHYTYISNNNKDKDLLNLLLEQNTFLFCINIIDSLVLIEKQNIYNFVEPAFLSIYKDVSFETKNEIKHEIMTNSHRLNNDSLSKSVQICNNMTSIDNYFDLNQKLHKNHNKIKAQKI